jgi:Na+/H+-dicarboxylate symporter
MCRGPGLFVDMGPARTSMLTLSGPPRPFMNLVRMIIAPIFFCTVVPEIASNIERESANKIFRFVMCTLLLVPLLMIDYLQTI